MVVMVSTFTGSYSCITVISKGKIVGKRVMLGWCTVLAVYDWYASGVLGFAPVARTTD